MGTVGSGAATVGVTTIERAGVATITSPGFYFEMSSKTKEDGGSDIIISDVSDLWFSSWGFPMDTPLRIEEKAHSGRND